MTAIIRTHNLTRRFGRVIAADRVDLEISRGEIYGFLGLNGAGKTTVIRMLLGMIRPTSGAAYLFGDKILPGKQGPWNRVGQMVETPHAYADLTVRENLEVFRRLRLETSRVETGEIAEQLLLTRYLDIKASNLSLGNAQRLGLAKALMHKPDLLILDEPANGLDPAGIVQIRKLLTGLAEDHGVTIFLSSHILGEVSRFATRIGIIHDGKLIREEETRRLHDSRRRSLKIRTADNKKAAEILDRHGLAPGSDETGNDARNDAATLTLHEREALDHPEKITELLSGSGLPPSLVAPEEEDLEQFFFRIIQQNSRPT